MAESKALSPQRQRFVHEYLAGKPAAEAARVAGYSDSYARKAASFLLTQSDVRNAIDRAQGQLQKAVKFSLEDAVADAHAKAELWKDKSPMASFKMAELRARLLGYLVEKIHMQVETIDLSDVLLKARARSLGREDVLRRLAELRRDGHITAADLEQVQDVEYTMVEGQTVNPFD